MRPGVRRRLLTPGFVFVRISSVSGRVAIFIDGGYLDHVLRDLRLFGKLDYNAFALALKGGGDLLRTYYYHCLPWQSPTPTPDESR